MRPAIVISSRALKSLVDQTSNHCVHLALGSAASGRMGAWGKTKRVVGKAVRREVLV